MEDAELKAKLKMAVDNKKTAQQPPKPPYGKLLAWLGGRGFITAMCINTSITAVYLICCVYFEQPPFWHYMVGVLGMSLGYLTQDTVESVKIGTWLNVDLQPNTEKKKLVVPGSEESLDAFSEGFHTDQP